MRYSSSEDGRPKRRALAAYLFFMVFFERRVDLMWTHWNGRWGDFIQELVEPIRGTLFKYEHPRFAKFISFENVGKFRTSI